MFSASQASVARTAGVGLNLEGAVGRFCRQLAGGNQSDELWHYKSVPTFSVKGNAIEWFGRLDNRRELIDQLSDFLRDGTSDAAIVAAAFDRWHTGAFERLIGDWAIAVWHREDRKLWLARDYIGAKSLFYYERKTEVLWSDELADLALIGDSFQLCEQYVVSCLVSAPQAHLTPYQQILAVPPGGFVCISASGVETKRYWYCPVKEIRYSKETEYVDEFRQLFRQAVRRRICGPGPILAELSGGFDSSSIVCMADRILAEEYGAVQVDTLSFFDSKEPGADDFDYFTAVERQRGRQGHHIDLASRGDSMRFQCREFSVIPRLGIRLEAQEALDGLLKKHGYRVILSGTGGDEVTGEAVDISILMADLVFRGTGRRFVNQLIGWSLKTRMPLVQLLPGILQELLSERAHNRRDAERRVQPWMQPRVLRTYMESYVDFRRNDHERSTDRPLRRDWRDTIGNLSRMMSFRGSSPVEKRFPYLDRHLLEFLANVPGDQLSQPSSSRYLVKQAFTGLLPREITDRRWKSVGASRAYVITIQRHWNEVSELLKCPLLSQLGFIDRDKFIEAFVELKNEKCSPHFLRLLHVLHFEIWLRDVLSRGLVNI